MKAVVGLLVLVLGIVVLGGGNVAAEDDPGKAIFDKKCSICHGKDGVAKKMAAGSANLNDPEWQKGQTVESVAEVIAKGKGKMPKNEGKLTPEEMNAIAAYVLTLN